MGIFERPGSKKNNPKADFSNVQSGSSSTAPSPGETTSSSKTYVVKPGDSLSKIAQREYGDASAWRKIYEANRDTIKDPDLIYPGQSLKLPTP